MNFNIGDWVYNTYSNKTYQVEVITDGMDVLKLWRPKPGELVCKKFSSKCFIVGPYGIPGFTEEHLEKGYLEPIIGTPSTFIKEQS